MTPTKTWKSIEASISRFFGTTRTPLSGGNGKMTRSDTLHPRLFIEVKQRKSHSTAKLFRSTKDLAKKESKIPVVVLHETGSHDYLIVCEVSDLKRIAEEVKE
jgi:hypothetical protein